MAATTLKVERIRDPLHNLIEFNRADEFENVMWRVLQTRPFQRLRCIKQLGFSDFVYPGACHSRFMHSVGVYHTARRLMRIVKRHTSLFKESHARPALAAALVHDLGHGPFSHAFETVGKRFGLQMAKHETVSDRIIRDSEVSTILNELGGGFAGDVADIVAEHGKKTVYRAVVSSQFDADRLDYMQRDRLMTGAQSGAIDFEWLLANLETAELNVGVDEEKTGTIETFVLGPKANMAAEAFVLGLFQLYPTIYFHKTTRVCECTFTEMLCRIIELVRNGGVAKTGLHADHPIVRFANESDNLQRALDLDDTVMWGALPSLSEASDHTIKEFSTRLRMRKLYKCVDVRNTIRKSFTEKSEANLGSAHVEAIVKRTRTALEIWSAGNSKAAPRVLIDEGMRSPYKPISESKGPTDRINILTPDGKLTDLRERSEVVAAIKPFKFLRAYAAAEDQEAQGKIQSIIQGEITA